MNYIKDSASGRSRVRIGPERTGTAFRLSFYRPERRSDSFSGNSEWNSDSFCCV